MNRADQRKGGGMSIRDEFENYDALGLAELVRNKEVTPLELVECVIERIEAVQDSVHPVNIPCYDLARELASGDLPDGPFRGVPWLLKDLMLQYEGVVTTNSLPVLAGAVADHDSEIVARAKRAGFVLVAKTNVPENGFCISTEPRMHGVTRNPWNLEHVAGGSSGGAASAVSSRVVPMAHASDGGGSIRIPASFNGLVGLKASRGRVTYAPDYADFWVGGATEGCVSLTVRDTAAYFDAVMGSVPGDPYEMPALERPLLDEVGKTPGKLKIAICTTLKGARDTAPACSQAVEETAALLSDLGHIVEEHDFQFDGAAIQRTFVDVASAEAATGMQMIEMITGKANAPDDFSVVNWQLAERGRARTAVDHVIAVETWRQLGRQVAAECRPYDVVVMPTMPIEPPKLGHYDMYGMALDAYLDRIAPEIGLALPFNCSGQPSISLPLHWSDSGLPVGVQFIGNLGGEPTLIRLAAQLEEARPWRQRRAPNAVAL